MPSNQTPLGALPSRFKKQRLLIVGCGDIGVRLSSLAQPNVRVIALTSSIARINELRALGITPVLGNLDDPQTLYRLGGLAQRIIHLAPPNSEGSTDRRSTHLLRSLSKRRPPKHLVYASTSGVYGDCLGDWVTETKSLNPITDRAKRRVDAERSIRLFGQTFLNSCRVSILRVPGIYALNRPQGTPIERLKKGSPVLERSVDVYTNHIHADDLARACWLAVWRGKSQRDVNTSDDSYMLMGDYMDWAADHFGYKRPPRMALHQIQQLLSAVQLSFMQESRRLVNLRMKSELRLKLNYPSVKDGLLGVKNSESKGLGIRNLFYKGVQLKLR